MSARKIDQCRICGSPNLSSPILDLGYTPLADSFLHTLDEPETTYPLVVVRCPVCQLVQLTHTVDRSLLYNSDYPYVSSTTATGRRHYDAMGRDIVERFGFDAGSLAVDIGSNVGVLLQAFQSAGLKPLGIEPVARIAAIANQNGLETINEFFSGRLVGSIVKLCGQASLVTGTNVIAHIDHLGELAVGIRHLLAPDGVFVFEAPYLPDLVGSLAYDTIYHEHLSYLAAYPVSYLMRLHSLELFDIEAQSIHGGTMRYFIGHPKMHEVHPAVGDAISRETAIPLSDFAGRVLYHRRQLIELLSHLRNSGNRIAAVSAPAKGMTLVNYCHLAPFIDFATEKAEFKIGTYTPGAHIPVLPDSALVERMPEYALLLAWNFAPEIIANLSEYRERGGKFIIPVPYPQVVE